MAYTGPWSIVAKKIGCMCPDKKLQCRKIVPWLIVTLKCHPSLLYDKLKNVPPQSNWV